LRRGRWIDSGAWLAWFFAEWISRAMLTSVTLDPIAASRRRHMRKPGDYDTND
jgi:hypothetical protein